MKPFSKCNTSILQIYKLRIQITFNSQYQVRTINVLDFFLNDYTF